MLIIKNSGDKDSILGSNTLFPQDQDHGVEQTGAVHNIGSHQSVPRMSNRTRSQSGRVNILQDASDNKDELHVMEGFETIISNNSAIRSRPVSIRFQ